MRFRLFLEWAGQDFSCTFTCTVYKCGAENSWGGRITLFLICISSLAIDPLLLEMTIQSLEDSVKEIKCTQETILVRLAAIEEAIRDTNTANRPKSPPSFKEEDPLDDCHDDYDYRDDYDPLSSSVSYMYPIQHYPTTTPSYPSHNQESPVFSSRPQVPAFSHEYRSPIQYPNRSHHSLSPYQLYSNARPMYENPPQYPSSVPAPPPRGQPAHCLPICPKKNANVLALSAIDKTKLAPPSQIVAKYSKLCIESKAPTLATKLARERFFGDRVLGFCTVMGYREQPGLPIQELNGSNRLSSSNFRSSGPTL